MGHNGAMAYVVRPYVSRRTHGALTRRVPFSAAPAGGCCAPRVSTRAYAPALRVGCDRVLTRYSRVLTRTCATPPSTRHSFVALWQSVWDAAGSARQSGAPERRVRAAWHCRVLTGYSSILTRYSRVLTSTHTVLCTPSFWSWANVTLYMAVCGTTACSGTARVEQHRGTHTVPKGYSHCTALPRRVHETPSWSCCSICETHWAVHGSLGHMRVWFVW